MTIYEFISLDEMEQSEAIWNAVQIGEREDMEHTIKLFQIDKFYVEVFVNKEHGLPDVSGLFNPKLHWNLI